MADDQEIHRSVTRFMLDTCRHQRKSKYATYAFLNVCLLKTFYGADNVYVFTSGSSAEMYLEPMLSCIGDMDIMYCSLDSIAVEVGRSPPLELPAHFHQAVRVHEIFASNLPGYIYLRQSYTMKRKNGRYVAVRPTRDHDFIQKMTDFPQFVPRMQSLFGIPVTVPCTSTLCENGQSIPRGTDCADPVGTLSSSRHGPATQYSISPLTHRFSKKLQLITSDNVTAAPILQQFDSVPCIHCPLWPKQAANWPARQRKHGWPDSATIMTVLTSGCDVVGAVHPLCKQDEWMREHQWRLSFSRAEVTLLNRWTPLQQIIYHMLRFFIKNEIISQHKDKYPDIPTLSGYHIKTLMMWACEERPRCWWSAESFVVKLCSSLIHELTDWVTSKHCQHYFISDCNLLDHFVDQSVEIMNNLKSVSIDSVLLHWFVNNYIYQCAKKCPNNVTVLLQDITESRNLTKAIDAVVSLNSNIFQLQQLVANATFEQCLHVLFVLQMSKTNVIAVKPEIIIVVLEHFDQRFQDYFSALAGLHVAYVSSIYSITPNFLELLCKIFEPHASGISNDDNIIIESGITGATLKAIHLAKASRTHTKSAHKLRLEMSKAFLHISLNCQQATTACMAHVLSALLYYKTGHYLTAIGHCKQVLGHGGRPDCQLRRIKAEYLTSISMNIDSILGLIVFYQHVHNNALNTGKQLQSDVHCAFTTNLLAHYLKTSCSVEEEKRNGSTTPGVCQLTHYKQSLVHTEQLLVGDILLFKTVELRLDNCDYAIDFEATNDDRGNDTSNNPSSCSLVSCLTAVALEKLSAVRCKMASELSSTSLFVINEFELLRLYKSGSFEELQLLCRHNIYNFLCGTFVTISVYTVAYPELLFLLEGELVSLCGTTLLLHPYLVLRMLSYPNYTCISGPTLSLYLLVECQKKLGIGTGTLMKTLVSVYLVYQKFVLGAKMIHDLDREVASVVNELDKLALKLIYRSLRLHIEAIGDH